MNKAIGTRIRARSATVIALAVMIFAFGALAVAQPPNPPAAAPPAQTAAQTAAPAAPQAASSPQSPLQYVERYQDPILDEIRKAADAKTAFEKAETEKIQARNAAREAEAPAKRFTLKMNLQGIPIPPSPQSFRAAFHFPPVSQDRTGTCWSFGGTSFLESDVARRTGRKISLSVMHSVYYEYLEKARHFVRERADPDISPGSEANAVTRMVSLYGIVPRDVYPGLPPGAKADARIDHNPMHKEIKDYLAYVKEHDLWNEDEVVAGVRRILNRGMGEPPASFSFEGREVTPLEFARDTLKFVPEDYAIFMSTMTQPFYRRGRLDVSDNWWDCRDYVNLPVNEWFEVLRLAARNGFTAALCGDTSEPGYVGEMDAAIIPDFDLPRNAISQEAREYRIFNESTTDDHCVHLVGHTTLDGRDWFLIKDSSRITPPGRYEGYIFYRDDYIRLKMLSFMLHKDAAADALKKIKE